MTDPEMENATLVLLHPIGLRGEAFSFLDFVGAHTPNQLGHGGRPRVPGMTLDDVADDVAANIEGTLDVAGFSFGGMVAMTLALRHPDRVRSLFVACAPATFAQELGHSRAAAAEAGMEAVIDSTLTRWFTSRALDTPGHPGVEFGRTTLMALDSLAYADGWRAMAGFDVTARLPELQIPTTCLAGIDDVSAIPKEVRRIADLIVGARYVEVDGPHMAFLENPAAVNAAINDHLAWVASS